MSDVRTVPSILPWISALPTARPLVRSMTAMGVIHWLADSFQVESRWMANSAPSGSVTALPMTGLSSLGKDRLGWSVDLPTRLVSSRLQCGAPSTGSSRVMAWVVSRPGLYVDIALLTLSLSSFSSFSGTDRAIGPAAVTV